MNSFEEMTETLQGHHALYLEILNLVEEEGRRCRTPTQANALPAPERRQSLLPKLNRSLDTLIEYRAKWQQAAPEVRAEYPDVKKLIQKNQDLIMKIIVQDRENEQSLLRQGLVPPRHLPSAHRQRPHFVADIYRRQQSRG